MSESHIVEELELEKALRVSVNQAPRRMWQDYFRCSETTYKWGGGRDPFDRFDPRHALARFLFERFRAAAWTISYETGQAHMVDTKVVETSKPNERQTGDDATGLA